MTISVLQVNSVIKTYMNIMKTKVGQIKDSPGNKTYAYDLNSFHGKFKKYDV